MCLQTRPVCPVTLGEETREGQPREISGTQRGWRLLRALRMLLLVRGLKWRWVLTCSDCSFQVFFFFFFVMYKSLVHNYCTFTNRNVCVFLQWFTTQIFTLC